MFQKSSSIPIIPPPDDSDYFRRFKSLYLFEAMPDNLLDILRMTADNLQYLDLALPTNIALDDTLSANFRLSLHTFLEARGHQLRVLRLQSLARNDDLNDALLVSIGKYCTNLQHLFLGFCGLFKEKGIEEFLGRRKGLRSLRIWPEHEVWNAKRLDGLGLTRPRVVENPWRFDTAEKAGYL